MLLTSLSLANCKTNLLLVKVVIEIWQYIHVYRMNKNIYTVLCLTFVIFTLLKWKKTQNPNNTGNQPTVWNEEEYTCTYSFFWYIVNWNAITLLFYVLNSFACWQRIANETRPPCLWCKDHYRCVIKNPTLVSKIFIVPALKEGVLSPQIP